MKIDEIEINGEKIKFVTELEEEAIENNDDLEENYQNLNKDKDEEQPNE